MTRLDVVVAWTAANAPQIGAALVAVTILGAVGSVALKLADERRTAFAKVTHVPGFEGDE